MGKRSVLIKQYRLVYRIAMSTGIRARPDLTGIHNTFKLIFCLTEFAKKTSTLLNNFVVLYKRADSVC